MDRLEEEPVIRNSFGVTPQSGRKGQRHLVCHWFQAEPTAVFVEFVHFSRAVAHPRLRFPMYGAVHRDRHLNDRARLHAVRSELNPALALGARISGAALRTVT